jgi:ABC-type multidrug transport system, ATPase and permease components
MKSKKQIAKKSEVKKTDYKVIFKIVKSSKPIARGLTAASVLSLISILIAIYTPAFLGKIIDEINVYWKAVSTGGSAVMNMDAVKRNSLILLGLYAVSACFAIGKMYLMNNTVSRHYTATTRINLSKKLEKLPVSFVDTTTNGEFISRMTNDVSAMGNTVHNVLDLLIQGAIQLVAITVMMMLINWALALVVLIVVPVSIIVAGYVSKKSEKYWGSLHKANGDLNGIIEESYANIRLIKAFNNEADKTVQHGKQADIIKDSLNKAAFYSQIVQPIIDFTNKLAYVFICILGGWLTINGKLSVGDVIAIILYSKMLSQPLSGIAGGMSMFQHASVAAKRVFEILEREEISDRDTGERFDKHGEVEFNGVKFSYKPDEPLIKDLSVSVKSGQKVAIVGPTGAGKTTLVNLLMRFYDVSGGTITVDGVDIYDVPRDEIRKQFGMVLQDTWLFNGTIFDNVAYGKEGATREEVERACDMSYCDHFIRTLPEGYNTIVNDDTTNLSGGQKQLLTIARAFLADRKMLILDEATSSVDTRTEILIQKAMKKLMKGRTCFVIAHRLSTIVDADIILVINNGDIVEKGTHAELLAKDGLYAKIYNSQYSLIKG